MNNEYISQYASAIYDLASETKNSKVFRNDLVELNLAFKQNQEFFDIYTSNNVDANEKKKLVIQIFKGKIDEYILNLLLYVIDSNDEKKIIPIIEKAISFLDEQLDIINVKVYSPFEIKKEYLDKLSEKIKIKTNKQPIMNVIIDPSLLGGIKVDYSNILIDNSIKNKLDQIRKNIRKGRNYVSK